MKKSLIHRFLNQTQTREELKSLHEQVNENEKALLESIEEDWNNFQQTEDVHWAEMHWKQLESKLSPIESKDQSSNVFRLQSWMKVAATFLILASFWFVFESQNDPIPAEEGFPAMITEFNDSDESETVILKDGTIVTLTAHSSLSYYENFNNRYRVVHLEGEAFFETDLENKRPFIVISDNITSICRGNEFSISAFRDSEEINVAIAFGQIEIAQNDKLNSERNKVAVNSCERYSFNKSNQQYLIDKISDCEFDEKVESMKRGSSNKVVML